MNNPSFSSFFASAGPTPLSEVKGVADNSVSRAARSYSDRIASASISTPFGNAATSTAARAG